MVRHSKAGWSHESFLWHQLSLQDNQASCRVLWNTESGVFLRLFLLLYVYNFLPRILIYALLPPDVQTELQRRTADFRNFFCLSKSIPEMSKNCQKARPLLTSCMMFAPPTYWKFSTCVDWALRTSHFPLAGVLLTPVSSVAAPFWWLRNHCVYLSRVLSWLIDVCIMKLSSATPQNIRWNYMKSLLFLNIHVLKS